MQKIAVLLPKFSYPDPKGTFDLVQIKGEMNGWNVAANPMYYSDGLAS